MSTTSKLTEDIMLAASEIGCRLFRNNTGIARYKMKSGERVVRYGVGPTGGGGGDLIGWNKDGIFISIEIKVGRDKQTENQKMWERWVNNGGGRAGVARSVQDALDIINGKAPPE